MLAIFIKYFAIVFCSIYSLNKILNMNISQKTKYIVIYLFSFLLSVIYIFIPSQYNIAHIPLVAIVLFAITSKLYHLDFSISLSASIISYALSYSAFVMSSLLICALFSIMYPELLNYDSILQSIISFFQIVIVFLLFKIKRLKNGMPFLLYEKNNTIGIYISLIIIQYIILIKTGSGNMLYFIPAILIPICFILIYIWWKSRIKLTYLKKMVSRECEFLNNEISNLKKDNERLSALVHKDNKMIPALILAVKNYTNNPDVTADNTSLATDLIAQLESLSKERKEIINSCISLTCDLKPTNIISIDALLNYMYQKAAQTGIKLSLNTACNTKECNLKELVTNMIPESDLCTILAEMIENAIISTTYNRKYNILVSLVSNEEHVYSVEVFDGGLPFDSKVLMNFGKERITTHKKFGTGIGLNTIYQISKNNNASIIIDETIDDVFYTKKMSIVFDNRHQYILKTNSRDKDLTYLSRRVDLLINPF